MDNCCLHPSDRVTGTLTPSELSDAEILHINISQMQAYPEEYKAFEAHKALPGSSKLLPLNPIMDGDGLVRSDGRLRYAK